MKTVFIAILLFLMIGTAQAADLTGVWKADFAPRTYNRPKPVGAILLRFQQQGERLTGTARVGAWPGEVEIEKGVIDGDHFRFEAVGDRPWFTNLSGTPSRGLPKLVFEGTISDGRLTVHLVWDSIVLEGAPEPVREYDLIGSPVE